MVDMEILTQMIKENARVQPQDEYKKTVITLTEPDAPDSTVTIYNSPSDVFVIKVDLFRSPSDIFKGDNGECKRADYVIISSSKRRIICIELKRTKSAWNDIVKQLKGAQCFVKYFQKIGKSFWQEQGFLDGYEYRFVSISHIIKKRKTRITMSATSHQLPENAMKIDWPHHIQFNKLAA